MPQQNDKTVLETACIRHRRYENKFNEIKFYFVVCLYNTINFLFLILSLVSIFLKKIMTIQKPAACSSR